MSSQPKSENVPSQAADDQQKGSLAADGWGGRIVGEYRRIKEHAETYPYVWGSYILVYGGFGLWLTYRWRALRRMEDSVRELQEKLRKKIEAEQLANSSKVSEQSANSSKVSKQSANSSKVSKQSAKSASSSEKRPISADKAANS